MEWKIFVIYIVIAKINILQVQALKMTWTFKLFVKWKMLARAGNTLIWELYKHFQVTKPLSSDFTAVLKNRSLFALYHFFCLSALLPTQKCLQYHFKYIPNIVEKSSQSVGHMAGIPDYRKYLQRHIFHYQQKKIIHWWATLLLNFTGHMTAPTNRT